MKIVYIAHNIAGDVDANVQKVLDIVRAINLTMPHVVPFAPYIADVLAMGDQNPDHRYRGMRNDTAHIQRRNFDELWDFSDGHSVGVKSEINQCASQRIPVCTCRLENGRIRFTSRWKEIFEYVHAGFHTIGAAIKGSSSGTSTAAIYRGSTDNHKPRKK